MEAEIELMDMKARDMLLKAAADQFRNSATRGYFSASLRLSGAMMWLKRENERSLTIAAQRQEAAKEVKVKAAAQPRVEEKIEVDKNISPESLEEEVEMMIAQRDTLLDKEIGERVRSKTPVDNRKHLLLDKAWLKKKRELEELFTQKKLSLENEIKMIHAKARKTPLDNYSHLELGEAWLKKEEELRKLVALSEKYAKEVKVMEQPISEVDKKSALLDEIETMRLHWKAVMTKDVHDNDAKNTPINFRRHLELAEALLKKEEEFKKWAAQSEKYGKEARAKA